MKPYKECRPTFLLAAGILLFCLSAWLNQTLIKPPVVISKQDSAINLNDQFLRFGFAGYKRLVADTLWIATLLESDLEHYRAKDLNSWMYLRFNAIAELDPRFENNYVFGARYLSIIKDDIPGGNDLLERGLRVFPDNRSMIELLAFNQTFELQNYEEGYRLYSQLATMPNPPRYLPSLLAKLRHQTTLDPQETLATLKGLLEGIKDEESALAQKLLADVRNLTIQIDLECLNSTQGNCSRIDPTGRPYRFIKGEYVPPEEYTPYRLHR